MTSGHFLRLAIRLRREGCLGLLAVLVGFPAFAAQQRPVFRAAVDRVRVDIIVTDSNGRFVDDLGPDDFIVYEDGVQQEVLELQIIDLPGGSIRGVSADESEAVLPAATRGLAVREGGPPTAASDLGAIVFLIDFMGLDRRSKIRFANQWNDVLGETESLGVPHAVYMIDSVGRLRELAPLTYDIDALRAAPGQVAEGGLTGPAAEGGAISDIGVDDVFAGAFAEDEPPAGATVAGGGDNPFAPPGGAAARERGFTARSRSLFTFEVLARFCDALATRVGRTALVWVSNGVTLGGPNPDVQVINMQREFHEAANSSNVSVYPVDPVLLADLVGGLVDVSQQAAPNINAPAPTRAGGDRDELGNSLRHAASATGGRHYIAWAEMSDVMASIRDDTGRYYLLTYAAPPPFGDGEYHEIRVQVRRPGLDVRSRGGYVDFDADERRSRLVNAALSLPGAAGDLDIAASAFRSYLPADRANVLLAVALDAGGLGMHIDDEGNTFASVDFHAAVFERDGSEILEEAHQTITGRLRPEVALTGAPPGHLNFRHEWQLEPGRYDLRVVAMDESTGRLGATKLDLDLRPPELGEWATSDLVLVEADARGSVHPVVGGRAPARRLLTVYVEVYGGLLPVISGRIRTPAQRPGTGADLLPVPLRVEPGRHAGSLSLPLVGPGEYLLEVRVADDLAGQERTFELPLYVVGSQ